MSGCIPDYEPWDTEQQALVRTLATKAKPATILARLALIGPPRTYAALSAWATRNRVSLRVHRNYKLPERNRRREWGEDEDAVLLALAGTRRPKELAEALNRKLGTRRTGAAVRNRARLLGVSLAPKNRLCMNDMVRIFPTHNRTVARWVGEGLLRAEQRGAGRKGAEWWFRVQDIEAFIRNHVYLFEDWRRVEAGRWRDLVRAAQIRTPYLTPAEAARRLGIRAAVVHRRCRRSRVPGLKRLDAGARGRFRIPLAALAALECLIRPSAQKRGAA